MSLATATFINANTPLYMANTATPTFDSITCSTITANEVYVDLPGSFSFLRVEGDGSDGAEMTLANGSNTANNFNQVVLDSESAPLFNFKQGYTAGQEQYNQYFYSYSGSASNFRAGVEYLKDFGTGSGGLRLKSFSRTLDVTNSNVKTQDLEVTNITGLTTINGNPVGSSVNLSRTEIVDPTIPVGDVPADLISISTIAGKTYRVSVPLSFENINNGTPDANGFLSISGNGSLPGDSAPMGNVACGSYVKQPGNTPGTLGACANTYSGMFVASDSNWTIRATPTLNTLSTIVYLNADPFVERFD